MTCTYEGCDKPVRAKGKCATHYWRDWNRENRLPGGGAGRPALDDVVYKIRYRVKGGASNTKHYSDPGPARQLVERCERDGTLLFYGEYRRVTS